MNVHVTLDRIAQMGRDLSLTAAHPALVAEVMKVRAADADTRYEEAKTVATVDNLHHRGVPTPPEFRITTRSFEEPALVRGEAENRIYFEDDHGFFEDEDSVITVFVNDDDSHREVGGRRVVNSEAEIRADVEASINEIGVLVATDNFNRLLSQLYALPREQRPSFVKEFVLSPAYLAEMGIVVPDGMKVQRSHFDDDRPTLFCVTKYLGHAYPWHKVTVTFDSETLPDRVDQA